MGKPFEFQPDKSLAVISYLAGRSGETMYTILKMIYISDRLHLERYARPITGDQFVAMKQGACPSRIYDSMKVLRGEKNTNYLPSESGRYLEIDSDSYDVSVKDMPPINEILSASEIECLDEVISILGRRGRWVIRDMAHDSAWQRAERNAPMDFMMIAETLQDGNSLVQHLKNRF